MNKKERKAAREHIKKVQAADLRAGMPFLPEQLDQLLDYLDANFESCDRTTRLTETFLQAENLEKASILEWLGEHGGYCDCEVFANLKDLNESLKKPAPIVRTPPRPQEKRVARSLENIASWNLTKLISPWRVANLHAPHEPLRLELGKKGGCSIAIIESRLPAGDEASDAYWSHLWYARTSLPARGELQVLRGALALPAEFQSTLVRSPSWTPVYCWVVLENPSWHLEVRTELDRCAGDLPQIASLISHLARGQA